MIRTERLSEDEIKVTTQNSRAVYEYIFEKYSFSWILREKRKDGEEVDVNEDTRISSTVRDAVKEEAHDPNAGILDNIDSVSAKQTFLNMKKEDTFAKWGEELTRHFFEDGEKVHRLADGSIYDTITECHFCGEEKYCRLVDGDYSCCTDCEDKNPENLRINRSELKLKRFQ